MPWISCCFMALSEWMFSQSSARPRTRVSMAPTPSFFAGTARQKVSCASPNPWGSAYVYRNQLTAAGSLERDPRPAPASDSGHVPRRPRFLLSLEETGKEVETLSLRLFVTVAGLDELSEPREDREGLHPDNTRGSAEGIPILFGRPPHHACLGDPVGRSSVAWAV